MPLNLTVHSGNDIVLKTFYLLLFYLSLTGFTTACSNVICDTHKSN